MRAVLHRRVKPLLTLALGPLASGADVHHQLSPIDLLGQSKGARVQRVGKLLVVLGNHAGPAAVGPIELNQLDVEQRSDLGHGPVQLGCEAAADAAGPVSNLHDAVASSSSSPLT